MTTTIGNQRTISNGAIAVPQIIDLLNAALRVSAAPDLEVFRALAVDENHVAAPTWASRIQCWRRLRRLYGLTPTSEVFRVLWLLWPGSSPEEQRVLAGLTAMAHDELFRATATVIGQKTMSGSRVSVDDLASSIKDCFPFEHSEETQQTIGRNAYTSWGQTGHLSAPRSGSRQREVVAPTIRTGIFALFLGYLTGAQGAPLLHTPWANTFCANEYDLRNVAQTAHREGLIDYRFCGGVTEFDFTRLTSATPWD